MKRSSLEISWQTLFKILVFGLLVYVLAEARQVFGALFAAVVIASGLDPAVSWLERLKINRLLGTFALFLGAGLILGVVLYAVVPVVVIEAVGFVSDFDSALFSIFGVRLPSVFLEGFSHNLGQALDLLGAGGLSVGGAVSSVFSNLMIIFAIGVISFYLSIQKGGMEYLLRIVLPDAYEGAALSVFGNFETRIRRWLGAQIVLSVFVGVVVTLGMWVLGVKYPIALGALAALLEVVPIIGPIVAGSVAFIFALPAAPSLALYVAIFFVAVQQIENNIMIPLVMGRTMKVHPVVVTVSLFAGGSVAGFFGVMLAVPVAVLAQEAFNYLAVRKNGRSGRSN